MLKRSIFLLFLSNIAYADSAVKDVLCELSNYTAKEMSSMHTTDYRNDILVSVAASEDARSITLSDVAEKAKNAYRSKRQPYLNAYTPYALLNMITHAALESNATAYEGTLAFTLDLCVDFMKKQHSICIMKSDKYSPSKKDKESLCSNFGISSVMDDVCEKADAIDLQKQNFFATAKVTYKSLKDMDYFIQKDDPKVASISANTGIAFAGGVTMLMGQRLGRSLIGQYSNSSGELSSKRLEDEKDRIVTMCKKEPMQTLQKYLLTEK